jgi:hypothetical protein
MTPEEEYAHAAKIVGSRAWREQEIASGRATRMAPVPPSPVTDAYFGVGPAGLFNFSNPHATRNWSVPKYR